MAVLQLEEAARLYETAFGMTRGLHVRMPERGVEVQFMEQPGTRIELLAVLGGESPLQKSLDRRGPGLHHLCFEVKDIHQALKQLSARGFQILDPEPRPGAEGKLVAFLHPGSALGVLIELQQA